jgi:hypothetical protein
VGRVTGRVGRLVLGWTLVVLGVAALILPGPGLLLLAAGLVVLSQEYEWAAKRVEPVRAKGIEVAKRSVRNWWTIMISALLGLAVIAVGVVWGLRPPPPGWWPIAERWWLPGGWGTGSSLIGSGLIAIGLLIYSYRRFRTAAGADTDDQDSSKDRTPPASGR